MTIQSMALIGTGVMGMGIAQIAAQAGVEVRLFDAKAGAAEAGLAKLKTMLEKLQAVASRYEELCAKAEQPDFYADPARAAKLLKELGVAPK